MTINPFEPDGHTISPAAIVAARKARNWTQMDLAYHLDKSQPYNKRAIAHWERGRRHPDLRAYPKVLKFIRDTNRMLEKGEA